MDVAFYDGEEKVASMVLPDNAEVFKVGDEVELMASKAIKFKVAKRTYTAYFPNPKDNELGKPNSFGWKLDVQPVTQQN